MGLGGSRSPVNTSLAVKWPSPCFVCRGYSTQHPCSTVPRDHPCSFGVLSLGSASCSRHPQLMSPSLWTA